MANEDGREQTLIRLDSTVKRRLERAAKTERRSMSMHVEAILDEHLPPLDGDRAAAAS